MSPAGPPPHCAHRPAGRRGPALLLLAPVLLLALLGGAATTPPAAQAATPLATLTVSGLTPVVGTPGGRLDVAGTVRAGGQRLRDVRVELRLSRTRLNSRSELAGVAAGLTTGKDGPVVAAQDAAPELSPGSSTGFDLGADLDTLSQLTDFGVYVVGIQVTASHRTGVGTVAFTRTFLPWVPDPAGIKPTGFTWLWPLVAHPTRLGDGTYADDSLATEMGAGGRLTRLSQAGEQLGQQVPLAWAIDPDLLDSAADMSTSSGYRRVEGDGTAPGGGSADALGWLTQVRTATATSEVVALPYGDPDVTALRRGGLAADIAGARATGSAVAAEVLGRSVTDDVAWPVDGYTDRSTLSVLAATGYGAVVLDDHALPTRLELNYTPGGRSDVHTRNGKLTGLVADSGLTGLLASAGTTPLLAAQRFLAETAMITAELPNVGGGRTILIAPPRRWDPPQEFLDRLVAGTSQASWMSGTALSGLRSEVPDEVERRGVQYRAAVRRHELPAAYLTAIRAQHQRVDILTSVLTDPSLLAPDLDKAVLRLESTWWRDRGSRVNRAYQEQSYVADQLASIHVQPASFTFGSHSGKIALTLTNGVDQEVLVRLVLEPRQPRVRLSTSTNLIRIGAGRKVQVVVPASAVAGGDVVVDASLQTPEGTTLPPGPVPIAIRITQYGTVALAITGTAAVVLVLAALVRLLRRGLRARRAPGDGPGDDPGDDPDGDPHGAAPEAVVRAPDPDRAEARSGDAT